MPSDKAMMLAQKIYGYVLQYGDWTDETLNVAVIIEAALAEREAQVRAEEREKVAGLVEALEFYADPDNYEDPLVVIYNGDKARAALATYNDSRKG